MPPEEDLRQRFLDALSGRHPAAPEPGPGTEADQAPPEPPTSPAAPLSFEQSPPAVEEVPAAMAALAGDPLAGDAPPAAPAAAPAAPPSSAPGLMDLGHDAQLQGTALGLRSIAQRLAIISEGLKLVPALKNIAADLERLDYGEVAKAIDALIEWAGGEERALMASLEDRRVARTGEQPGGSGS